MARHRSQILRTLARVALAGGLLVSAACTDAGGEPNVERSGSGGRGEPAVVTGFDGSTIHVGILVPSSGPSAEVPADRAVGVKAYLDYVNTELGGIGGRYAVEVDVRDSTDPTALVTHYNELRDTTVLLAQIQGRDAVESLAPLLAADRVLAGPAPADLDWVRNPNLLQTGTPDQVVGASALAWLADDGAFGSPGERVCSATQAGSGNDGWQAGIEAAAEELAVEVAPEVTIPATPKSPGAIRVVVDQLREAGCTTVLLGAGAVGTTAVFQAAVESAFTPTWVAPTTAIGGALGTSDLEAYVADHVVAVGDGPTEDPPAGLRELVRIHEGYAPGEIVTPAFTAGYLQGKAIVAVLEAAVSRGDLSRAGVLAAAARLRSVRFDGIAPDAVFGTPDRRVAPTRVGIAEPDADQPTRLRWVELGYAAPAAVAIAQKAAAD